jgi:uncharacterized Tic20 family protein
MSEEQSPGSDSQTPESAEQQAPSSPTEGGPAPSKDERTMGMLCHLLAIFTGFIGPLILYVIKKDESQYIADHGKEALNFQLTVLIAFIVSGLLVFVFVGCVTTPLIVIANLVLCIMGAMKANSGEMYRYPIAIRMVK